MKRFLVFLLLIFSIAYVCLNNQVTRYNKFFNFPDIEKDTPWEFVKERVFNGHSQRVFKYKGPILIRLSGANYKDSLAVNQVLLELKKTIPSTTTIAYFDNFIGNDIKGLPNTDNKVKEVKGYRYSDLKKYAIRLNFKHFSKNHWVSTLDDKTFFTDFKDSRLYKETTHNLGQGNKTIGGLTYAYHVFRFKPSQTIKQRKDVLTVHLVRTLACASYFNLKRRKNVNAKSAILNSKKISYTNTTFTDLDKFLLQKLYAPTFKDEFKAYMYKTYPWNYASNYINKYKTSNVAIWLSALLVIVLFLLVFGVFYKRQYKYQWLGYLVPLLVLFIGVLHVVFMYQYIILHMHLLSLKMYLIFIGIILLVVIPISLILMFVDHYIAKADMSVTLQIVIKMGLNFVVFLVPMVIFLLLNKSFHNWFFKINTYLILVVVLTIFRGVILYLDVLSQNLIKRKDIELIKLKALKADAEVKLLQSQINPHFLYNALNSIASLATKDAVKTEKMALSLSDFFKYSINREGKKYSTIKEEVVMVTNYLEVEKIRFGDRLKYNIYVDMGLHQKEIPMFLIQPLVENAVKHGTSKIEHHGAITLTIKQAKNHLKILVQDNGPDFLDDLVSGHGLQSVYDLLDLTYGKNAYMNIENKPKKQITITIKNWGQHV